MNRKLLASFQQQVQIDSQGFVACLLSAANLIEYRFQEEALSDFRSLGQVHQKVTNLYRGPCVRLLSTCQHLVSQRFLFHSHHHHLNSTLTKINCLCRRNDIEKLD